MGKRGYGLTNPSIINSVQSPSPPASSLGGCSWRVLVEYTIIPARKKMKGSRKKSADAERRCLERGSSIARSDGLGLLASGKSVVGEVVVVIACCC